MGHKNIIKKDDIFKNCLSLVSLPNLSKWKISDKMDKIIDINNCLLLLNDYK